MDKKKFGQFIKEARMAKGLTQATLAEQLFIDVTAVSKWERGINFPDISMISDICKNLGISEHELSYCFLILFAWGFVELFDWHRLIKIGIDVILSGLFAVSLSKGFACFDRFRNLGIRQAFSRSNDLTVHTKRVFKKSETF